MPPDRPQAIAYPDSGGDGDRRPRLAPPGAHPDSGADPRLRGQADRDFADAARMRVVDRLHASPLHPGHLHALRAAEVIRRLGGWVVRWLVEKGRLWQEFRNLKTWRSGNWPGN